MALRDTMAIILGGGQGSRLYPLTKLRSKPAVPIGGKYRLIDIPISNCLNAGIHNIYVLTQFMSVSLHRHIQQTYRFDVFSNGYVQILAAQQSNEGMDWYLGTADAVRKQLHRFVNSSAEDILILSGDHLYRMDYARFVRAHRRNRADISIAVQPVRRADATRFGILRTDSTDRITAFQEKPQESELDGLESNPGTARPYQASLGIYIFRREVLREVLENTEVDDFGKNIIPGAIDQRRVFGYPFRDYWEDIGTIRSLYEANLALTVPRPRFDFYDTKHPIYTRARFLPSSRADGCDLQSTVMSDGCRLEGIRSRDCVIGLRSVMGRDVEFTRSVQMGADFYETPKQRRENRKLGRPDVGIGPGCRIEGAIIDKNARIGQGVIIHPHAPGEDDVDTENYVIRDGIVVVPKNATLEDGTEI